MGREDGKTFRMAAVLVVMALAFVGAAALRNRSQPADDAAESTQGERARQQAQAAPSAATTPAPTPAAQVTPPAEGGTQTEPIDALNPKRGPGAVLNFDADSAPLVPGGGTARDYVTEYYGLLLQRDYDAASALVPKEDPAQGVADFLVLLAGYEPEGFFITDVTDNPGGQTVTALQFGADNRSWNTVWEFVDTARGRVLKDVKYALPQGGACH